MQWRNQVNRLKSENYFFKAELVFLCTFSHAEITVNEYIFVPELVKR